MRDKRLLLWAKQNFETLQAIVPAAVATIVILVVIAIWMIAQGDTNSGFRELFSRQHTQLVQGCERLNVKQTEDNTNQFADYLYDLKFIELIAAARQPNAAARRATRDFLRPLRAAERAKAWIPIVPDCTHVGAHYRLPSAVPFSVRMPPPIDLRH